MNSINRIYQMLDWNNDKNMQLKGIEYATKMNRVDVFIQPVTEIYSKNIWDNCAVIVAAKTDDELKDYLQELFDWLQDLNWPGSFTILKRINAYNDREAIQSVKNKCKRIAIEKDDKVWLENLDMID